MISRASSIMKRSIAFVKKVTKRYQHLEEIRDSQMKHLSSRERAAVTALFSIKAMDYLVKGMTRLCNKLS